MWKFHRSMTRPFFSHDRIGHFNIFDRHAEDAITQMKLRFRAGHPVDFQVNKPIITLLMLCKSKTKTVGCHVSIHARLGLRILIRKLRAQSFRRADLPIQYCSS